MLCDLLRPTWSSVRLVLFLLMLAVLDVLWVAPRIVRLSNQQATDPNPGGTTLLSVLGSPQDICYTHRHDRWHNLPGRTPLWTPVSSENSPAQAAKCSLGVVAHTQSMST